MPNTRAVPGPNALRLSRAQGRPLWVKQLFATVVFLASMAVVIVATVIGIKAVKPWELGFIVTFCPSTYVTFIVLGRQAFPPHRRSLLDWGLAAVALVGFAAFSWLLAFLLVCVAVAALAWLAVSKDDWLPFDAAEFIQTEPCPECGLPRLHTARICRNCGLAFDAPSRGGGVPRWGSSRDVLAARAKRDARERRVHIVLLLAALATGLGFAGHAAYRAIWPASPPYTRGFLEGDVGGLHYVVSLPTLSSVSVPAAGAPWIVGSVAWRWDGTEWRKVPLPRVHDGHLLSVAAVAADDLWAVGREGDANHTHGLIEHWDGVRWSVVRPPAPTGTVLTTVSAAGPRNVWAGGVTWVGRPLLLHWNGTAWRTVALPWSLPDHKISTVVAVGSNGLWVVETTISRYRRSEAEHFWDGKSWQSVPPPFGPLDPLKGFSASAWNDAWAVGNYYNGRYGTYGHQKIRPLAAHWDGRRWHVVAVPETPGYQDSELTEVADVGPGDAWAVGQGFWTEHSNAHGPHPVVFHWDGKAWHLTAVAVPQRARFSPHSLAAGRDGSAWAVGTCRYDNVVYRWAGGEWVVTKHPIDAHWKHDYGHSVRLACAATR